MTVLDCVDNGGGDVEFVLNDCAVEVCFVEEGTTDSKGALTCEVK